MITRKDIQTVITETQPYAKFVSAAALDQIMSLIEQEREEHKQEIQKLYQLNCICQIHGTANNGTCPECLAEQYQELVDAAVAAYKELEFRGHGFSNNSTGKKLDEAIKPFLEPQSIADELDALASDLYDSGRHLWERKLRELADRYRELHGEGRDE